MGFDLKREKILVTGAAGFIGSALIYRLIRQGINVIGIDNLNNYYDNNLKKLRIKRIENIDKYNLFKFLECSIDNQLIFKIFEKNNPHIVINLAAQAGVRYSITNPSSYIKSNIIGFSNILEACRKYPVKNLIYASSSSVYGSNTNLPFNEDADTDSPISLYAATKKSNEIMAHSYSHLYNIPSIGLRFFTVYGPWGRPDMAPMIFADSLRKNLPIKIFNNGDMKRDFTFIEDVVDAIIECCQKPANLNQDLKKIKKLNYVPHKIFNVGNGNPVQLLDFISFLENKFKIKAIKEYMPIQPGDVKDTFADISKLNEWIGFTPKTDILEGVEKFSNWYMNYYQM
tara:strand:- start:892 stop:1917 length:1026 start_codon:yes stop_codon:yes gene_type:complete